MPSPIRITELTRLLKTKGYFLDRISGSHHIFKKDGEPFNFSVPVHKGLVKPIYAKKARELPDV